jgi:hypothetical protein
MAVPVNKPDERDEPKRKSIVSPGGQEGFLRSRRKCMNLILEKFPDVLVSPVYLSGRVGLLLWRWSIIRGSQGPRALERILPGGSA